LNPQLFLIGLCIEFLVGSFILGLIVLVGFPAFRLSIPNLLAFVMGAIPGIFMLSSVLLPKLNAMDAFAAKNQGQRNEAANTVFFFGAFMGGTIMVFLKMLLSKAIGGLGRPRNTTARK
jgi:hypothetical protein